MDHSFKIQIRFSDCDMMGHVNNACFLNYFELARMHYLRGLLPNDWDWKENGIILKKNTVEYHVPLYLTDDASILVSVNHIGTKSFTLAYLLKVGEITKSYGESVIVCFDFTKDKTKEIPNELKKALENKLIKPFK